MFRSFYAAAVRTFMSGQDEPSGNDMTSMHLTHALIARSSLCHRAKRLVPLLLLFICVQVHATDYSFPNNPPSGCVANTAGSGLFTCGPLTLGAGDTISVAGTTQITINGDFNTGASVGLNANGNSANLTIYVSGITTLGADNTLHGSIIGTNATAGTITTGANNTIVGNLSTTTAGVINTGDNNTITGNLSTYDGAINVGDGSTINGNILVVDAGAILLHINVTVNGNVSSTVKGSDTGAGAITIYGGSTVNGNVNTFTGAITVEVAPTGSAQTHVTGNIGTSAGAITVATDVNVNGSVCTGSAGAITIGASATIGGNVEAAQAGAVTVGTGAVVSGDVAVQAGNAKSMVGTAKEGTRIGSSCGLGSATPTPPPRVLSRFWRQLFVR